MTTEGEQKVFVIEPHSPYYLHPAEGPGALITAMVFDGKNYDLWAKAVKTALKSKNKIGFIDRSITKPKPKEGVGFSEYHAWDMMNSMICSWILNVIEPRLLLSVAYVETDAVMWQDLQKRYGVANAPRIYQLKAGIADCKQGGLDMAGFLL